MKQIIKEVLDSISDNQINLGSLAARENISQLITDALKSKGCYTEYDDEDLLVNGYDIDRDEKIEKLWPGLDVIENENKKRDIAFQLYNELTADGLPSGGDVEAVLESQKLAEEIVNAQEDSWIYESPDGGKTVFRRAFADYDAKNKEEIDWKTKEPTGRIFSDYNGGQWRSEDNE